jgi:uncharacterized protein
MGTHGYRHSVDVPATMRDGTVLRADVYRPAAGGTYPVLLMRTPYGKSLAQQNVYAHPSVYTRSGFVVVVQDVRGRYASEGSFYPLRHEGHDGADTVEWCRTLGDSSGEVFLYGYSYAGAAALHAAAARPPGLAGVMPAMTWAAAREGLLYRDGVLRLGFAHAWALQLAEHGALRRGDTALAQRIAGQAEAGPRGLPVRRMIDPEVLADCPYFLDWLDRRDDDGYWDEMSCLAELPAVDVPVLLVAGWYDEFLTGTLAAYQALTVAPRDGSTSLLVGPWCHAPWTSYTGAVDFGPRAAPDIDTRQVEWVRDVLSGGAPGRVRYFVMGANDWRTASAWPPEPAHAGIWYLRSEGGATGSDGNGRLTPEPGGAGPADHLWVDPSRPVPSLRGPHDAAARTYWGPVDQAGAENRRDVLCYTTAPLAGPVTVSGRVTLSVWVATEASTVDLHVTACHVHRDGRSYPFSRGVRRCDAGDPADGSPATAAPARRFDIRMDDTSVVLPAGHRLRLSICGTSYPAWVRDPQSGVRDVDAVLADLRVRAHLVLHDPEHPSHLTLDLCEPPATGDPRGEGSDDE